MNLQYSYSPNQNNGQITQFRDTVSGEQVSYAYDSLNRLISATAANGTWGQGYTYDGYGNLLAKTVTQGSGPQLSVAVAPTTNRVIGVTYDANGNVIQEMNGTRLVYNAFNRVRKVTFLAECTYGYGPDNEQVETNCTDTGGPYTVLYGADGRRMGGYSSAVDRTGRLYFSGGVHTVYFAGRPIDVSGRMFLALDRLGSVRPPKTAQTRTGYYPYGEEQQASTTEWWNFATYYRHPGTELDYAVNRYYSPRLGRFMSPDPYYSSAALTDPRQWNRYSYVGNDPVNFNDPSGDRMNWFDDGGNGGWGGPYSVPVWGPEGYEGSFFVFPNITRNVSFAPSGGGGGGAASVLPVTNLQKSGTTFDKVRNRLNDIVKVIDPDCLNFLQSGGSNLDSYVSDLLSNDLLGVANFDRTIAAFTGTGGTSLSPGDAAIVVNDSSAFFSSSFKTDQGKLTGGTARAQAFILLHELAHALSASNFQPDFNNR